MSNPFANLAPPGKEHEWPFNGLTLRQEIFAVAFCVHGNATRAYCTAYTPSKSRAANSVAGCRMKKHPKVISRIQSLYETSPMKVSLEEHLRVLEKLRDGAVQDGKWGDAVKAEMARGKVSGLYAEKTGDPQNTKTNPEDLSLEELDARIAAITGGVGAPLGDEAPLAIPHQPAHVRGVHDFVSGGSAPSFDLQEVGGGGDGEA